MHDNPRLSQFPHIYIVEASAGSGKTYTLAKRYLQLLSLMPYEAALNTILAITFTNKSAREMKERIMEFLKRVVLDKFNDPGEKRDILSIFSADEQAAREKACKIMDGLIRNYNFFQVETIDSFINSILSACSFRLDLSANFKTENDYADYLKYGLDRLIDRIVKDNTLRITFEGFIRQYLHIDNRTSWFPKQQVFSVISSLFSKSNSHSSPFVSNNIAIADIIALKKNTLELMRRLQTSLPEGTMLNFAKSLDGFLLDNKEGFDIDSLSEFFKRADFPAKKGYAVDDNIIELWNSIREYIVKLCRLESASVFNCYIDIFNGVMLELKEVCAKEDVLFLEALNKQASLVLGGLELPELYCRLSTVFRHFLIDEFQDTSSLQWNNLFIMIEEALAARGSLFYVGDKKQAIYRFRGGQAELIDSVKGHFSHIDLIEDKLTKNYRSRKEIVEFNNQVFSTVNLRRFLSTPALSMEPFFSLRKGGVDPQDIDGIIKIFEGSGQSCRDEKDAGYVKSEFIDYRAKEDRDIILKEKLVNCIRDVSQRFPVGSIALLVRKNDDIELLTTWLLENGIPVASEKTLNIRDNPYIKELVSFLKFLSSPVDSLSFASFILGDIFLNAAGLSREDIEEFIFEFNRDKKDNAYLYTEFRSKFPGAWDGLIEEFFKNVGFVPFYELVVTIFAKFNVADNFSGYQGFFMKFLELIKENEEERFGIAAFLEFFEGAASEQLYVNFDRDDAVKILTIHKAKGLEFAVVIIPFLEFNIKMDNEVVKEEDKQLRLVYLKKEYAAYCPELAYEYKQQCLQSLVDELNSIYVAFTRAIDELYIFVPAKSGKNINPARFLFSSILPSSLASNEMSGLMGKGGGEGIPFTFERGRKTERSQNNGKEKAGIGFIIDIPASEYKDWITILKDEFIDRHILEAKGDILKGNALHFILSFIGNTHNQDRDKLVRQAIEQMRLKFPAAIDYGGYEQAVNNLLREEKLRGYFDAPDAEVYTEKEIVDSSGNTKRIDRLILTDKEAVVVDYKSSRSEQEDYHRTYPITNFRSESLDFEPSQGMRTTAYSPKTSMSSEPDAGVGQKPDLQPKSSYGIGSKQVAEYMDIVRQIYPGLKARGVLVYLDDLSCEEIR